MKISKIQSAVIFILVILTFIQTGELWFGDASNRNFFYSFFNSGSSYASSENLFQLSKPYRIINSKGNGKFFIKYTGIDESEQKKAMDDVMIKLFKEGEFVKSTAIDWQEVLDKSIIFEYKCQMPADAFTASYKQKSSLLHARFKEFNTIFIISGNDKFEPARVLFFGDAANVCYEYKIPKSDLNNQIITAKENFSVLDNKIYYIASKPFSNLFSNNAFMATWEAERLEYSKIEKINPYSESGGVLLSTVEKKVDVFFDNPPKAQPSPKGVFAFSDENTVVKYYPTGVLECFNYKAADEKINSTFTSAYNKAIEFIKRDTTITDEDEYYLAEYAKGDDGNWIFSFDFTINDFPIYISETISAEPRLKHAIEVTVSHDFVVKYMRYAYSYKIHEKAKSIATKDYNAALNQDALVNGDQDEDGNDTIKSIDIGYRADSSDNVNLFWYIGHKQGDTVLSFPAY